MGAVSVFTVRNLSLPTFRDDFFFAWCRRFACVVVLCVVALLDFFEWVYDEVILRFGYQNLTSLFQLGSMWRQLSIWWPTRACNHRMSRELASRYCAEGLASLSTSQTIVRVFLIRSVQRGFAGIVSQRSTLHSIEVQGKEWYIWCTRMRHHNNTSDIHEE